MYDSSQNMPVVFLSIFVSLLPQRYRGHWLSDGNVDVRQGAIVSSVVQFVSGCAAMWAMYPAFLRQCQAELAAATAAAHGDRFVEAVAAFSSGPIILVAYILRPLTLLLLYFALEGAVRIFATVAADQVLPTLPFQLIAWGHELVQAKYHELELGERTADLVEPGVPGQYDLKVLSCRPKEWGPLITIRYNDQMYEVQDERTGLPPWRYVYLLRLKPESKIVRGLHDYDPGETLRTSGWAELPPTPRN